MKTLTLLLYLLTIPFFIVGNAQTASAHGLIWSLPEDGAWVRYEGDFKQLVYRPDNTEGDLKLTWRRHLEIRSVGKATGTYKGKEVPCRWVEIESVTGREVDGAVEPGPGGRVIYKLLIPEAQVPLMVKPGNRPAMESIPISRGYRQVGDEDPQKIPEGAFQAYPVLTLLRQYRKLTTSEETTSIDVPTGAVEGKTHTATTTMESPTSRSKNTTEIESSTEIPFGLARWKVTIFSEKKDSNERRDVFERATEITITMSSSEMGENAQSKIADK